MYTHRTGKDAYLGRNLEAKAPPSMKSVIATVIAAETGVCRVAIREQRVNDKDRWGVYDSISECFDIVLDFSVTRSTQVIARLNPATWAHKLESSLLRF